MEQSTPNLSSTQRRSRVEGTRSKSGCKTCISKKVKCDERPTVCRRCERLHLQCHWDTPQERLAERRRGFGPIKARQLERWRPPIILPKFDDQTQGRTPAIKENMKYCDSDERHVSHQIRSQPGPIAFTRPNCIDIAGRSQTEETHRLSEVDNESHFDEDYPSLSADFEILSPATLTIPTSSSDSAEYLGSTTLASNDISLSGSCGNSFDITSEPLDSSANADLRRMSFSASPSSFPRRSAIHLDDNEALSYFQNTFAHLKSTRSHTWSAHSVFLYQASKKQTALHFLLAVSHNELAIHCGRSFNKSNITNEAREHYERGSHLLLQTMTGISSPDRVGDLISFLYMYMFWMRRDTVFPERLIQISKGVLTYVMTHDVVSICNNVAYKSLSSNLSGNTFVEKTETDCALLARVLIYLYDRDIYCAFYGCGGHFANYIDSDPQRRRDLFAISRTFMLRYWGKNYPRDEFIQDIEQARTYEMYFDAITICQQINIYSQKSPLHESEEMGSVIRRRLDSHEIEYSLLFQLVALDEKPRPNVPLLAYVSITFFYALQIYFLRCFSQGFGSKRCLSIQHALRCLIATAHLALSVGPIQLLERFQWALLIAGIESDDAIHREWIFRSISDPAIETLLRVILDKKKELGGTITIPIIRQLVNGNKA